MCCLSFWDFQILVLIYIDYLPTYIEVEVDLVQYNQAGDLWRYVCHNSSAYHVHAMWAELSHSSHLATTGNWHYSLFST